MSRAGNWKDHLERCWISSDSAKTEISTIGEKSRNCRLVWQYFHNTTLQNVEPCISNFLRSMVEAAEEIDHSNALRRLRIVSFDYTIAR